MEGASVYVDLAMTWGAKHGVGVLLDLQAAPGSQNGCAVYHVQRVSCRLMNSSMRSAPPSACAAPHTVHVGR